jgi:FKBP-type peptidyl-prolyl cis-trans isomerase FkpA/FKBP-type peptidyl-prolyl cis-trans isomerase FklB
MIVMFTFVSLAACADEAKVETSKEPAKKSETGSSTFASEDEKNLYALGVLMARGVKPYGLTAKEIEIVTRGLTDSVLDRDLEVDGASLQKRAQTFMQERQKGMAAAEKEASAEFLEKAASAEGAVKTESGLIITEIEAGDGDSPEATDTVKVHYHGTLRDGTVFDSSVDRGSPATFPLNRVIPCWTEGVQKMKVGGKSKLVCPSNIAYGDRGSPPRIKPGAALIFEVELLEIVKSNPAPKKPAGHP